MAQKAKKDLAARNAATLNRTHSISLGVNALYLLLSFFIFRRSLTPYFILNSPALIFEFWFERIGRPTHSPTGELTRAGEDLEAKGLTEWMWDVVYWTWGVVLLVALAGDWGWYAYGVVPVYSAWSAWATWSGMKSGLGGMMAGGATDPANANAGGQSKRQAKLEKRGGQRVQYR